MQRQIDVRCSSGSRNRSSTAQALGQYLLKFKILLVEVSFQEAIRFTLLANAGIRYL